jgi:holo-[acyl-carrier-protein] synthase
MRRLKASITKPLNFEMAATEAMLDIALRIRPHACCLVPEKRTERTTEGGLDVVGGFRALKPFVAELGAAGIRVSMFIEPSGEALKASADLGAPVVELHTGAWCDALARGDSARADYEFGRLRVAAAQTPSLGLECHAGHGLDYDSARIIAELPQIVELNRPLSDRRGDFCRPRRDCEDDARRNGGGPRAGGASPMIVGVGSDLCDVRRIEHTLDRFGQRFIDRCFTEIEQRRSDARAGRAASYAKRFAAKEACAKALGTGLRHGVFWRDMGVVNLPSGQPTMRLTGGAAQRLKAILPPGAEAFIHLTITDEASLAQAFVVIEARAANNRDV